MSHFAANYPEILAEIHSIVADTLAAMQPGNEAAFFVTEALRQRFGGEMIYIPKGKSFETDALHAEIYERFDGHNHKTLAHAYHLSVIQIYSIIKKQHKIATAKRQRSLDDLDL